MKATLRVLLLIVVCVKSSNAAMRYDKAPPLLHSVLNSHKGVIQDRWTVRMNESREGSSEREYYRAIATPANVWRARGIGFTIAGGAIMLAGGGLMLYAGDVQRADTANGGRDHSLMVFVGAAAVCVLGLIFLAIGLPIWLTHLHG